MGCVKSIIIGEEGIELLNSTSNATSPGVDTSKTNIVEWRKRLKKIRGAHSKDSGFNCMCALYAANNDSITRLYALSDAKEEAMIFYSPQLGNYLLNGSDINRVQLECFFIDRSLR